MAWSRLLLIIFLLLDFTALYSLDFSKEYILVYFKDKDSTQIDSVQHYLSEKSIQRRTRQGLNFDIVDVPVSKKYLDSLQSHGIQVVDHSKWLNAALVAVPKKELTYYINDLQCDFIQQIDFLGGKSILEEFEEIEETVSKSKVVRQHKAIKKSLGIDTLHRLGFKGKGMDIAIVDAGYTGVNRFETFEFLYENGQIKDVKDFTLESENVFASSDHGTKVLSMMASSYKGEILGGAPEASFWLLKTENIYYEHPIEEFYFVKALEYSDSVGIDIVNASLGYNEYDDSQFSYKIHQLYKNKSIATKVASLAASRGMVLVVSAGNEGELAWKEVTFPADAENILAVAPTSMNGDATVYGSYCKPNDKYVRPNVAAPGHKVFVIDLLGQFTPAMGSSYATPVITSAVACLWQKYPQLSAKEIIRLIEQSAEDFPYQTIKKGYGTPDMKKAIRFLDSQK